MARRGGTLRIVAGELGGRRFRIPQPVRPTTERVRAAIFDALGGGTADRVLDCFAGSGGLGLEALSRGAVYVRFVEQAPRVAALIRSNVEALDMTDRVDVVAADALTVDLRAQGPFGLVLADPPYADDILDAFLSRLTRPGVLAPSGLVAVEHSSRVDPPAPPAGWSLWKTRVHGDAAFTIYQVADLAGAAPTDLPPARDRPRDRDTGAPVR